MEQQETLLNGKTNGYAKNGKDAELKLIKINQQPGHRSSSPFTDSIDSDSEKERMIACYFKKIMEVIGLNMEDDSLKETPRRVAKMYVREIFAGLNPKNKPAITLFDNKFSYNQMLVEKDISFYSNCEHHFVPFTGKAHVAYISSGKVIGLSKLNRIVQYFAHKPQLQERLTVEIATELKLVLQTEHVAVIIEAQHHCVMARGIKDATSKTVTAEYSGRFLQADCKNEFQFYLR